MSRRLADVFVEYAGVDLDAMVIEARKRIQDLADKYLEASLEDYSFPDESFDLVLSMACLGNVCPAGRLPQIASRICASVRPGGKIVLIDAFHRNNVLTRCCRLTPKEVITIFTSKGTVLDFWGGLHFFPLRLAIARASFARMPRLTTVLYRIGEGLLRLSPRLLSDYSVIVFRKPDPPRT